MLIISSSEFEMAHRSGNFETNSVDSSALVLYKIWELVNCLLKTVMPTVLILGCELVQWSHSESKTADNTNNLHNRTICRKMDRVQFLETLTGMTIDHQSLCLKCTPVVVTGTYFCLNKRPTGLMLYCYIVFNKKLNVYVCVKMDIANRYYAV